jgi:AcrR family transcriptional regulator
MPRTLPSASPRKTPRQSRSAEMVRSIVEAAARILETEGHTGYNTNAVARVAGVSPGSLYQYFPNKAALTKALILRETSTLLDDARRALAAETGREALILLIAAALHHQMRRPALARLLDFEEAMMPADADLEGVMRQIHAILVDILCRPDLPTQSHVDVAASDVIAILKGIIDAAGARLEGSIANLSARVSRAVFGYLSAVSMS